VHNAGLVNRGDEAARSALVGTRIVVPLGMSILAPIGIGFCLGARARPIRLCGGEPAVIRRSEYLALNIRTHRVGQVVMCKHVGWYIFPGSRLQTKSFLALL
jgi:hypothetical protein